MRRRDDPHAPPRGRPSIGPEFADPWLAGVVPLAAAPGWLAWMLVVVAVAAAAWAVVRERRRLREREVEMRRELAARTTQLERANERLTELTLIDPLTGQRNRRYLAEYMENDASRILRSYDEREAPERSTPNIDLLFLMVDVDHFKEINDMHGHAAGDMILRAISQILRDSCRESDTIVRWGGEEFLVVGRYGDRRFAPILAERIRRRVSEASFDVGDDKSLSVTCSVGFACFPFDTRRPRSCTWQDVVSIADTALYAAKSSGRNAWVGLAPSSRLPDDAGVLRTIQNEPEILVEDGRLLVASSLSEERAVVWR